LSQILVTNLYYDYPGKRALDNVSLSIAKGEITALVGPNGAGKTTLLRCLAALETPTFGTVEIDGMNVAEHPRACHRKIGYLSDFFGLYDDLTVRQSLQFHAAIHDLPQAEQAGAIERTTELLQLDELLGKPCRTLSRGQRQRVGIAQAVIHSPQVLLLDEPASGLDPEARWKLSSIISGLAGAGMTLIVSSHILSELEDYSTHMMVVRDGRLVLHEPLSEAARRTAESEAGRPMTCMRIELSGDTSGFEKVLTGFADVERVAVHGNSATVFLPATDLHKSALLRHLVEAGLPVTSYTEDRARVHEVYFALLENDEKTEKEPSDGA